MKKKSDLTKDKIVLAAIEEFSIEGLHKTSLRSIARRMNASAPYILYHFESLEILFKEAVLHVVSKGRQMAKEYSSPATNSKEALENYIYSMVDWIGLSSNFKIILLQFYHHAAIHDDFKTLNDQIVQGGQLRIQAYLEEIKKEYDLEFESQPMSISIQDLITGALIRMCSSNQHSSLVETRKNLKKIVFSLF